MMSFENINNRLKQLGEQKQAIENEIDFLYDQLIEIRETANDIQQSALYAMNGGEAHV
jgi:prefoldin subunit 5